MKPVTVTYFEHYPHYTGTMNARWTMSLEEFVLLVILRLESKALYDAAAKMNKKTKKAQAASNEAYDIIELFDELVDENAPKTMYATYESFERFKTLNGFIKALARKGFIVDQWEEGSYYFALNGFECEAMTELAMMEAQIELDTGEFD